MRKCEFCGCNTNAKVRACCDEGREADLAKAKADGPKKYWLVRCKGCNGLRGFGRNEDGIAKPKDKCPKCKQACGVNVEHMDQLPAALRGHH